ncbi:helix-turn-helix transcriptional regulator [Paenibacillus popilliae]|uniref:DNA-binding domain-containing protein n=1 Tax=Paenibacillus popilliae ATCC 14706 TaxID=1212764 RepID=M9M749_PAEPP|nr:helix-turn-helix domain-containing protein [Paenibacillus popilliae]GAC43483.1 DNA-binding domain-containing protein [Paenibacillus popilliae ATCC 14706]
MKALQFTLPPLPYYIYSGAGMMEPGQKHASRRNIEVFDMLFVTGGCLHMHEEKREYAVHPDHVLILRPDQTHGGTKECGKPTTYFWLHFQTEGAWEALEDVPSSHAFDGCEAAMASPSSFAPRPFLVTLPQFGKPLQPDRLREVLLQLQEFQEGIPEPNTPWKEQMLFQQLFHLLSVSADPTDLSPAAACAERAAAYFRRHYREDIKVQALGNSLNFHPVYIARCMQKQFGCSPIEYLTRCRIEQAKLLLHQTDLPISRIAEEVGFHQAAYFAACFSRYEGMSPRRYRQQFFCD